MAQLHCNFFSYSLGFGVDIEALLPSMSPCDMGDHEKRTHRLPAKFPPCSTAGRERLTEYFVLCLSTLLSMTDSLNKPPCCHPERLKKIEDFRRESKDLRTDLTANVIQMRRFWGFADAPLRMTDLADCAFFRLAGSSR